MGRSGYHKNDYGQTALETAIILIAFVVVASVFAFTILSASASSPGPNDDTLYAGLSGIQSGLISRGSAIAQASPDSERITSISFNLTVATGGDPLDLTTDNPATTASESSLALDYQDGAQSESALPWSITWFGQHDGDALLETGELVEITVDLSGLEIGLGPATEFTLEVRPPAGAVLRLLHTTPAEFEAVMELR